MESDLTFVYISYIFIVVLLPKSPTLHVTTYLILSSSIFVKSIVKKILLGTNEVKFLNC
jgi:hypothetical protein